MKLVLMVVMMMMVMIVVMMIVTMYVARYGFVIDVNGTTATATTANAIAIDTAATDAAGAANATGNVGYSANVGDATVDATGSRGTRRYGRRRRREEARGCRRWTWLTQTTIQNEFEVVPRSSGRDRLATHQSRHRCCCLFSLFFFFFSFFTTFYSLFLLFSLLILTIKRKFELFLTLPMMLPIDFWQSYIEIPSRRQY